MSYIEHWQDLTELANHIESRMQTLAQHAHPPNDPLAGVALEALCQEFALRGQNRATSLSSEDETHTPTPQERDLAHEAFEFGIRWGRLGKPFSSQGSTLIEVLGVCLNNYALSRVKEGIEVQSADVDPELQSRTLIKIFRQAVAYMDEALAVMPDVDVYQKNRKIYADELARIEAEALRFHLFRPDNLP